jgi:hypothetical protein
MSKLTKFWKDQRNDRWRELMASNIEREAARFIATQEALGRQVGEGLIGRKAALAAQLYSCIKPNGILSIYLKIAEDDVPPARRPIAAAWAESPGQASAVH